MIVFRYRRSTFRGSKTSKTPTLSLLAELLPFLTNLVHLEVDFLSPLSRGSQTAIAHALADQGRSTHLASFHLFSAAVPFVPWEKHLGLCATTLPLLPSNPREFQPLPRLGPVRSLPLGPPLESFRTSLRVLTLTWEPNDGPLDHSSRLYPGSNRTRTS